MNNLVMQLASSLLVFLISFASPVNAADVPISLFDMSRYDQNIDDWIKPSSNNYHTRLVSKKFQTQRSNQFKHQWLLPWDQTYINDVLNQSPDLYQIEQEVLQAFNNKGKESSKIGYAENFRPYKQAWLDKIIYQMNAAQFQAPQNYNARQRGIVLRNTQARALPTNDVYFHHFTLPGQGYPFDLLQVSSVWAGTPVYIIGTTRDKSWSLVLTPAFIAWVPSNAISKVKDSFANFWSKQIKKSGLVAITHNATSIVDHSGQFLFKGYVGSVFPLYAQKHKELIVLVPVQGPHGQVNKETATLKNTTATLMPMAATPNNFISVMKSLLNRPYGWGGMYFYNDCSQELKSVMAPFGIWLPRHSSYQVNAGKLVNKTSLNTDDRVQYLSQHGHPFMTLVYIGGHVFLYLGNYTNPKTGNDVPLTYQDVWGMVPHDHSRRAVIGQSVIFPLLKSFPQDPTLQSEAANSRPFQVSFLDEMPATSEPYRAMIMLGSRVPLLRDLVGV